MPPRSLVTKDTPRNRMLEALDKIERYLWLYILYPMPNSENFVEINNKGTLTITDLSAVDIVQLSSHESANILSSAQVASIDVTYRADSTEESTQWDRELEGLLRSMFMYVHRHTPTPNRGYSRYTVAEPKV